ncbi:hypothetical protein MYCTH_94500 [Thermothelomyces thermophilus ATCC 42464]|uniref:Uncharacterized protein n=1 Tax=Thermothelomyces thermophilus (strain ATCC 42464 / BCRC 31852 / DSM 1799) TaxID=573729 RepID=G2QBZ8_THET4|nr:uncharacterized protein MYCTH_94500 [Thermothelomyces thermophilus ATCC 42464]AEO57225.1 hypothetical protein MYCTH_94500 [Thermothelomyces thermophilus ATCC 42464]
MYLPQLLPKSAAPDNKHSSAAAVSPLPSDGSFRTTSESESASVTIPPPATRGSPPHQTLLALDRNEQHQHHAASSEENLDQTPQPPLPVHPYYHTLGPPRPLPSPPGHDRRGRNVHGRPLLLLQQRLQAREAGTMRAQNVTIGIVVGVLLAVFLAGFFYFVWRYHRSIRIRRRGGHHRRTSKGSRSSASQSTGAAA